MRIRGRQGGASPRPVFPGPLLPRPACGEGLGRSGRERTGERRVEAITLEFAIAMKTWIFLIAVVSAALIWFRSGRRWGNERRGNAIALFVFLLMLGGMVAMVILAVKLF